LPRLSERVHGLPIQELVKKAEPAFLYLVPANFKISLIAKDDPAKEIYCSMSENVAFL
jgi:hypothetical protein